MCVGTARAGIYPESIDRDVSPERLKRFFTREEGGYLWLGSSETAGNSREWFEVEYARHKIYVRKAGGATAGVRFRPRAGEAANCGFPASPNPAGLPARADVLKEAERVLLAKYVPPGVVISPALGILQFRGEIGAYLTPATGAASFNLLNYLQSVIEQQGAVNDELQSADDGRKRAVAAGFDRYPVKPVNLGLLRQWLQVLT